MKKHYLPFFLMLLTPLHSSAQQQNNTRNYCRQLIEQLASPGAAPAQKTNGISQRLIAHTSSDIYQYSDSTTYSYSNGRGSAFDFNAMQYHTADDEPVFFYTPDYFTLPRPYVLCDQETGWEKAGGGGYTLQSKAYCTYNTNGTSDSTKTSSATNAYFYNSQGQLQTITHTGTYFTGIDSMKVYYSPQGQRMHDTLILQSGIPGLNLAAYNYTYDSNGNIVHFTSYRYAYIQWELENEIIATYSNTNHLTSIYWMQNYLGDVAYQRDSFTYTSGVPFYTYRLSHVTDFYNNTVYETTKHLNAQLLPDTVYYMTTHMDSSIIRDSSYVTFTYNNYGNPVESSTYDTSGSPSMREAFYYELYNDLSVPANTINLPQVRVFPNPANDRLQLVPGSKLPPATIHLINTLGQVVLSKHTAWQNTTEQLSISDLANGMYWISITGDDGTLLCRQAIVKK